MMKTKHWKELSQKSECDEALRNMKDNKSPGSDGLPSEFYKTFWQDIKNLVTSSLYAAYDKGELSPTQKRGHLTLLFKKMKKDYLKIRGQSVYLILTTKY